MSDVIHYCAICDTSRSGSWATPYGIETDMFVCDECCHVTHADCEESDELP